MLAAPASFIPLISDNWTPDFTWLGVGAFPAAERQKLHGIVEAAHSRGRKVRFRATPDAAGPARDALWNELPAADADFVNTDDLPVWRPSSTPTDRSGTGKHEARPTGHHTFGGQVSRPDEPSATPHLRPNAAKWTGGGG